MLQEKEKYLQILERESMNKFAWNNLGELYLREDDFFEAKKCFENAIDIDGNYANALYNLSLIYLYQGNYQKGFKLFEYRSLVDKRRNNFSTRGKLPIQKRLNRLEKLNGKTLYIYQEEDFRVSNSDYIFLARFIPLLKKYNCKIIMDVDSQLVPLFKNSNLGIDKFNPLFLNYDYHIPLFSLPMFFDIQEYSIPFKNGYLRADNKKIEDYKNEYFNNNKLKIGLYYQKNSKTLTKKSIDPMLLEDLFDIEGVQFYSFQKSMDYRNYYLVDIGKTFKDTSDVAGALSNLDLMIGIDSVTTSIACALNIPTWILLDKKSHWKWQLNRVDSPWFNSAKLIRQIYDNSWSGVILNVKENIEIISRTMR